MSAPIRIGETHNRALCCECGTVRTFAKKAGLRNPVTRPVSDAEIAHHRPLRPHLWERAVAWERWLADFKCATCKKVTRHALLRDCSPEYRDWEETDPRTSRPLIAPRIADVDHDAAEALQAEIRRLEGFGVRFEWRHCKPDVEPTTLEVEQTMFDLSWTITLNAAMPPQLLLDALANVWPWMTDKDKCEKLGWKTNKNARYDEFTYKDPWIAEYVESAARVIVQQATAWSMQKDQPR